MMHCTSQSAHHRPLVLAAGAHVTRFIALAAVGNTSKQKFLHALALIPAAEMDAKALTVQPPNTTASPYEEASSGRKRPFEALADNDGGEQVRTPDCIVPAGRPAKLTAPARADPLVLSVCVGIF